MSMRVSYSLGSLLTINDILDCANLSKPDVDTIWVPETWGMENFSILSAIAQKTAKSKIGSSIINIYSRSPATIAMGAVTVDTISRGRLVLGLGTSSIPIVEEFHGCRFEKPLTRMKEYVDIIRLIISGNKINYDGTIFKLKNFTLLIKPYRKSIPIYLAAVNQKMVNLTWNIADGVIFYLRPMDEMKKTISLMQSKRRINVACQLITCMSKNTEKAVLRAKKTLAFYISVGKIYRDFLTNNGFATEAKNIFEEYKKTGFNNNYELVTKKMLDSLVICGNPSECKKQLERFQNTGIDLPIIQFNPIGNVKESFKELQETFSGI